MTGTLKARYPSGQWTPILGSGQEAASVARWNSAWGAVGWTPYSGALSVPVETTNGTNIGVVSWTAVAGRRYRAVMYVSAVTAAGARGPCNGLIDGVLDSSIGGPWMVAPVSPNEYGEQRLEWDLNKRVGGFTDGVHTFQARLYSRVAGDIYRDVLFIEDMGPVVQASIAPPTAGPRVVASGNALGVVAIAAMIGGSPQAVTGGVLTPVSSPVSFLAAAGRRYRLRGSIRATSPNPTATAAYLRISSAVTQLSNHDTWAVVGTTYQQVSIDILFDGTGLIETFTLNITGNAAINAWSDQIVSNFYVEDVGPNTYPALPISAIDPPFTPATMKNAWVNNVTAGTWGVAAYRKIGDEVSLRGMITAGAGGTVALTLPPTFRPAYQAEYVCSGWSSSTGRLFTMVSVSQNGDVIPENGGAAFNVNFGMIKFATTP
jgi:hypothetical protein